MIDSLTVGTSLSTHQVYVSTIGLGPRFVEVFDES
jgi:hypothetical protein